MSSSPARTLLSCLLVLAAGAAAAGPAQDAAARSTEAAVQAPTAADGPPQPAPTAPHASHRPPVPALPESTEASAPVAPATTTDAAVAGDATGSTGFSLVTLNLYHDRDDWPRRRTQIVDTLRRLRPDAVALQEVLEDEGLPNQAAWLAHELGYAWYFVTTDPPSRRRRYGNALLTRQAAIEDGQTLLHPLEDHRVAGMVRVLAEGHPLNLYVTHLHWTPEGGAMRARQVEDLMAWIAATADGAPSVVAGDLNAEADAPELAPLREGHDDAWQSLHPDASAAEGSTLNPHYFAAPARIDHVFVERGRLRPVEASLLFTAPDDAGTWASDHRGLLVRLRLAEEAAQPAP